MTDWYELCKANYEKVAADLIAQGYQRIKRSDIYKEHFCKAGKIKVIVRELGSSNWWTKDLTFYSKEFGYVTIPD